MDKLFTVAGTSNLDGVVKFRVANGSAKARTKVLERSGHTDINLQDLPKPMTKEAAMAFLNYVDGKTAKAPAVKAVKAPAAKPAAKTKPVKTKNTKTEVVKAAKPTAATVETAPASPTAKSIDEVTRIKAKNLETMRAVTRKLQALRSF